MAAVSPLFCVSSPASSPVKLEGPGFVVYRVCKRIRDTGDLICPLQSAASPSVPLIVVDDDDAPSQPHPTSLLSQQGCIELVDGGEWKAANLRPKRLRLDGIWAHEHEMSLVQLMDQLGIVEQPTSGFQNNCLWFSTQLAMGRLRVSRQDSEEAQWASSQARLEIHQELERAWPVTDAEAVGPNDSWWAGSTLSELRVTRDRCSMMSEPHLFALAHLLQCKIMVVDTRWAFGSHVTQFLPGYAVMPTLTFSEAACEEEACVWIRLHDCHFRGLVRG